ncbi:MAG: hypothetical protein COX77_01745, partial [Candidatus Komeilibacteria bacterium CG_4_10_14_0_2_um_filter_37_10]
AQNTESGYLCALAIAQRKPILYLLPLGNMIPDEIKLLQSNPQVSKLLMVKFFQENNIESRLAEFIDLLENGRGDWELPTIKFTWRISPRIERYLRWKTVNTKKTKADWLREYLLKEIIDKDEEYKGFLRNI